MRLFVSQQIRFRQSHAGFFKSPTQSSMIALKEDGGAWSWESHRQPPHNWGYPGTYASVLRHRVQALLRWYHGGLGNWEVARYVEEPARKLWCNALHPYIVASPLQLPFPFFSILSCACSPCWASSSAPGARLSPTNHPRRRSRRRELGRFIWILRCCRGIRYRCRFSPAITGS